MNNTPYSCRRYVHPFLKEGEWLALIGHEYVQEIRLMRADDQIPSLWQMSDDYQDALCNALNAYFESNIAIPSHFIRIAPTTDFKTRCRQEMCNIPSGSTISYGELARRAGSERAIRAAGSACATNPTPILVPCHRIVKSDGSLGGFAWGLEYKEKLLALEHTTIALHT